MENIFILVAATFEGFDDPFWDGGKLGHVLVAAGDGAGFELGAVLGDLSISGRWGHLSKLK